MKKPADLDPNSVRKTMTVRAPVATAWRVFTGGIGRWWPLGTHKIGKAPAVDAVIEPQVGGRWYERSDDGSTCDWGRVLVWEPPMRLVLSWQVSADWQHDPSLNTEVEVRFTPEGADATRLDLEHRLLAGYGARRDEMHGIFDSDRGWTLLLQSFVALAAKENNQ